jgi:GAF domain-containing protein
VTSMEPIPETAEAIDNLDALVEEGGLLAHLTRLADRGKEIVPDLVGVSIAPLDRGVTYTLVATAAEIAVLDAIQYAAGGPCVEAAHAEQVMQFDQNVFDEDRWRLFAQATAARTVRSTLTLPVTSEGRVVGTVNLYAASRRAFDGHHEQLAEVFGAWAAGAVTNADLSFSTRKEAEVAPQVVREQLTIDRATGIVAADLGVDAEAAEARLRDAASRAGVSLAQLAAEIITARERRHRDDG